MAKRLDKTLADYVVGGVMPCLLIGLLVSLCFFLLELAYSGAFMGQMKWILFFFIVGTVLIARISMRGDISERAGLYGIAMAIAAGMAMVRFVEIPRTALGGFGWIIPFSLMSIIWWSAHKLTQDSTWDDEEEDDGGGLLDAQAVPVQEDAPRKTKSADWFDRYQEDRKEEQRKKKPGLMVVYFSLAALPLFGVGQAMIPASNIEGRRYAFWMLTIYVGCGLGMLLTTSFLGLRRYLRGRRLQMPASMTALWLGLGAAMILTLMVLSAVLLPRPEAEYHVSQLLGWATSKERDANKTHFFEGSSGKSDEPGTGPQNKNQPDQFKGQGNKQGKNKAGKQQNQQGNQAGGAPDKNGQPGQSGQKDGSQGQGKQGGSQGKQGNQGSSKSNEGKNSPDNQQGEGSQDGKQGQGNGGNQKTNSKGQGKQGDNQKGSGKEPGKDGENGKDQSGKGNEKNENENDKGQGKDGGNDPEKDKQGNQEQRNANQQQQDTNNGGSSAPPPPPQQLTTPPTPSSFDWLKWIVYGLMLAGILFALWKWGRQLWEALKQIWRDIVAWWQNLLPQKQDEPQVGEIPDPESNLPPKPFAWFSNPLSHPNNFRSMEEMIRYSFAALHSWAYEQKLARQPNETATEFAQRLGESFKHAHQDIRKLADLYSVVTYARVNTPSSSETILRNFWLRVGSAT
ncbi:MAG TPA: DUF4129 domain-containing protein [Gemmatales bacterium]|nr:DUF4129 domain-containing protein [Gemmatales bacterium]